MPKRLPDLPEPLRTGLITTTEAAAHTLSCRQLSKLGFRRLHRDQWVPADVEPSVEIRCTAALRKLPPGAAVSHRTVAELLHLPMPEQPSGSDPRPIHVSVPSATRWNLHNVALHRVTPPLPTMEFREGSEIVLTDGPRTWLDLAAELERDDLVILGDEILRRELATKEQLREAVRRWGRRRGARSARIAVELLSGRARSPMETRVRLLLVDNGYTGFLVNETAVDEVGGFLATPDIQFRALKVAIEYEGDQHRTDKKQWDEDIRRYELLQEHGWIVIRLTARDIFDTPQATIRRIQDALDRRRRALAGTR